MNTDKELFEQIFKTHYNVLMNYARGILKDDETAKEIVQEVFLKIWEAKNELLEKKPLLPYLIRITRNKSIDYVRHQSVKQKYLDLHMWFSDDDLPDKNTASENLVNDVKSAINRLPPKCQQVFKLSRYDNLSHKEIALKLTISTKTVENHITKAIVSLKQELVKYKKTFK